MPARAHRPSLATPLVVLAATLAVGGCAYPRRATSLSRATGETESSSTPANVYTLTIVSATVPPHSRGGLSWDDNGGLADPYVRVYRGEEEVWESPVARDTLSPAWNVELPRNFYAPPDTDYRFELWDKDDIGADPIGIYRSHGPPGNLIEGADASLLLDSGAQLSLRLSRPQPHHGIGIRLYEVHGDELVVVEVETHSPAGRAGIVPGDRILAIGGQTVTALGSQRASGALSMASERHEVLRVRDARGEVRDVEIDRGYTWLTM